MTNWTQQDAIAFECAREVITDLMAIRSGEIAAEERKQQPDMARLTRLRQERSQLAQERARIHVQDQVAIARIRTQYGAEVRAHRVERHAVAA